MTIYGTDSAHWQHLDPVAKDYWLNLADAILAILPGKTEQEVRAEALRDAKTRIARDFTFSGDQIATWLDALANEETGVTAATRVSTPPHMPTSRVRGFAPSAELERRRGNRQTRSTGTGDHSVSVGY